MCYIYKFWWNSVSKYMHIGFYRAIRSYSTGFNISHLLLSHDHYIKQNIRSKLTSGLYSKWCVQERTSCSMEARRTLHIHSLMVMPISLTVKKKKLQNKQAYKFSFCQRSLTEKQTFCFADERRSIKDCSRWNICSRRRKESVFLGHLNKGNIYTFYKVSTYRSFSHTWSTCSYDIFCCCFGAKENSSIPKGLFRYTNMAAMRSMWKRSIPSNHCL